MILQRNKHLNGHIAPIIAEWPGQLFIRKAITQLHNGRNISITNLFRLFAK